MRHHISSALLLLTLCSCANYKDVPYLQNSREFQSDDTLRQYDMTIKPKDELSVFVFSPNKEAVAKFNMRTPQPLDISQKRITSYGYPRIYHYLVDNEGNIDFPIIGKVNLLGLTIEQANARIKDKVAPYIQQDVDYTVNVLIDNFEVSVIGEVKSPNTFIVTRNKMTILEALAQAGDMTIYGKRDNVKLLREQADGTYEVHELDLRDANILNSPYYYLQQRDVVYVEPNEAMAQNSKLGTTRRLWIRGASITISLGSLLYRVLK